MSTTLEGQKLESAMLGQPAWDVARLFPNQGYWSVEEFLDVTRLTNRLVEYADGFVEVLPMPTLSHQKISGYLYDVIKAFVKAQGLGVVLYAPYKVRVTESRFREPDVIFVRAENEGALREDYSEGADLVIEIVSEGNRDHDLVTKRREYAQARIPEYWIVDPTGSKITVLTLPEGATEYAVHGEFTPGQQATSVLLPGLAIDVKEAIQGGT